MPERPLAGVRVIAVSQYGAGPFASMHLADLGADVIKVEDWSAGGDMGRHVPPYAEDNDSLFFQSLNRSKRSICLDLRKPEGQEVLRELAKESDVVFSNLRGDRPKKLGLTYEQLKDVNPQIVCCSLSGYGMEGPKASDPAFDYLIQAEAGIMSMTGDPDGPPMRCGISVVDFAAGYAGSFAIAAGIVSARQRGRGHDIDVSLYEVAVAMLNYLAIWHLSRGFKPERLPGSAHPSLVPSQTFNTADGTVVIMCNKEVFFPPLCEGIGRPELAEDPRFVTAADRLEHRKELIAILNDVFLQESSAEWMTRLEGKIPIALVNDIETVLKSDLVRDRGVVIEVEHPFFGRLREVGTPFRFEGDTPDYSPAPPLGAHTEEVLSSILGYDRTRMEELRAAGVIGPDGNGAAK